MHAEAWHGFLTGSLMEKLRKGLTSLIHELMMS